MRTSGCVVLPVARVMTCARQNLLRHRRVLKDSSFACRFLPMIQGIRYRSSLASIHTSGGLVAGSDGGGHEVLLSRSYPYGRAHGRADACNARGRRALPRRFMVGEHRRVPSGTEHSIPIPNRPP